MNEFKFIIEGKCCSFYNMVFFIYKFDDYMNDILDFEMSMFNINYKKNILYNQYPSYLFRDEHFRFGLVFT